MTAKRGETGGRGSSQADILIDLAESVELFHTPYGTAYADLEISGHRETRKVRTKIFKNWLALKFFEATKGAPSSEALLSALNVMEARARFDAPELDVNVRVAGHGGRLYLDLCDKEWRAVEIDDIGWRVIDNPPVRFCRAPGMKPLPVPLPGGSVDTLCSFLNVDKKRDFVLVVAWALAVLRNCGPYPVLALSGEQGSAKSTFSAVLRNLLDPNTAPLRALPREDRDLFIAATNGHVLSFDNVSRLSPWISDTLCRLATGGGFAVRQLYTDQDEVLFDAARPVVLNGIEDIVTRPDLADRAIFLTLEPISEASRRPEKELLAEFEKARPQILGALLDAVSIGLQRLPYTKLDRLPRMADFAIWVTACESALWTEGTFMRAYDGNRDEAVDSVIEADTVGSTVRSFMASRTVWTGTATELLVDLFEEVSETVSRAKTWPATPRALSSRLRRVANILRKIGIDISFDREGGARTRTIRISLTPDYAENLASAPSASSTGFEISTQDNGSNVPLLQTVQRNADANGVSADANEKLRDGATVREYARKSGGADGTDGRDAKLRSHSSDWRADI